MADKTSVRVRFVDSVDLVTGVEKLKSRTFAVDPAATDANIQALNNAILGLDTRGGKAPIRIDQKELV